MRRERRRDQVREEILDATRSVLLQRGLTGLTLAAVAKEVQLTKAALYHYYPSKEALEANRGAEQGMPEQFAQLDELLGTLV